MPTQSRGHGTQNTTRVAESLSVLELLACLVEQRSLLVVHIRISKVERADLPRDDSGDDGPGHPLVVGRNDVPRSPPRARGREGLLVRLLVVVPELSLLEVRERELPVLVR